MSTIRKSKPLPIPSGTIRKSKPLPIPIPKKNSFNKISHIVIEEIKEKKEKEDIQLAKLREKYKNKELEKLKEKKKKDELKLAKLREKYKL